MKAVDAEEFVGGMKILVGCGEREKHHVLM